jgi:hypothetical protein
MYIIGIAGCIGAACIGVGCIVGGGTSVGGIAEADGPGGFDRP